MRALSHNKYLLASSCYLLNILSPPSNPIFAPSFLHETFFTIKVTLVEIWKKLFVSKITSFFPHVMLLESCKFSIILFVWDSWKINSLKNHLIKIILLFLGYFLSNLFYFNFLSFFYKFLKSYNNLIIFIPS